MCEYSYTLSAGEIRRALWATRRRPVKAAVQTGLLALLSVSAWAALLQGHREGGTWLLAVAMPLLTAGVWVIPAASFRREAAEAAPLPVTLRLSAEAIGAGETDIPLTEATLLTCRDMVIWRADKFQMIAVPRRALPPEEWGRLWETAKG